eukprot:m.71302 g.71302  ORF g.71302 m.71302 type:complete len:111 (-) comp50175_c0_seq1:155-487(-)
MPASVGCFRVKETEAQSGLLASDVSFSSACELVVARISPSPLPSLFLSIISMRPARRTLHVSSRLFAMLVKDEEWDRSQTVSFSFLFDLHDDLFWSFLVCCSQCSMTHCS